MFPLPWMWKKEHAQEAARQLVFITFVLSAVIAGMCLLFNGPMLALIFGKVESAVMVNAKSIFSFLQSRIHLSHYMMMDRAS